MDFAVSHKSDAKSPGFFVLLFLFCIVNFVLVFDLSFCAGLGERILREDKEMREMKRRLVAIEADLQALYRDDNDESEVNSGFLTDLIIFC